MSYPSYLIHFNPNHDPKTGRFDRKPYSFDYYDYSKDHIDRVMHPKFKFVVDKEIYTDKNGEKHELPKHHFFSRQTQVRKKYGSERPDEWSLYAKNKKEDVDLHRISAIWGTIGTPALIAIALVTENPIGFVYSGMTAASAIGNYYLADKINKGLMNTPLSELPDARKAAKAALKKAKESTQ